MMWLRLVTTFLESLDGRRTKLTSLSGVAGLDGSTSLPPGGWRGTSGRPHLSPPDGPSKILVVAGRFRKPTCRITRMGAQHFRILLLRRFQLPLPLTVRSCRCGHPLDIFGHHRAAYARAGVASVEKQVDVHCDGSARRGASHNEGVTIFVAERRKEIP